MPSWILRNQTFKAHTRSPIVLPNLTMMWLLKHYYHNTGPDVKSSNHRYTQIDKHQHVLVIKLVEQRKAQSLPHCLAFYGAV